MWCLNYGKQIVWQFNLMKLFRFIPVDFAFINKVIFWVFMSICLLSTILFHSSILNHECKPSAQQQGLLLFLEILVLLIWLVKCGKNALSSAIFFIIILLKSMSFGQSNHLHCNVTVKLWVSLVLPLHGRKMLSFR